MRIVFPLALNAAKIAFSVANSPLVKTAIAGEDPNWGRIIMAIGKSGGTIDLKRLSIKFGELNIVYKGKYIAIIVGAISKGEIYWNLYIVPGDRYNLFMN